MPEFNWDAIPVEQRVDRICGIVQDLYLTIEGKPEKEIPGLRQRLKQLEQEATLVKSQLREANLPLIAELVKWYSENIETVKSMPKTLQEYNRMRWTLYGILLTLGLLLGASGVDLGLKLLGVGGTP